MNFTVPDSPYYLRQQRRFCSRRCSADSLIGRVGIEAKSWKGGRYIDTRKHTQYVRVLVHGHPYSKDGRVPEHRLVMEQHLGRYLKKSEVVHHIDRNGLNNELSNLELLTTSQHMSLHQEERRLRKGMVSAKTRAVGAKLPLALYESFQALAHSRGVTLQRLMVDALRTYLEIAEDAKKPKV